MSYALSLFLLAAAPPTEEVQVRTESVEVTWESHEPAQAQPAPLPDCLALPCPDDEPYPGDEEFYLDDPLAIPEGPVPMGEELDADADQRSQRRRAELEVEGAYFSMGLGPVLTIVPGAAYPGARYQVEAGFVLEPAHRRHRGLWLGAHGHIDHYFDRKYVAGGLDLVATKQFGPFYVRGGLGTSAGLPRYDASAPPSPGMGGVIGLGIMGGDGAYGRIGVDYDVRVARQLEVSHTVMLTLHLAFGP